MLQPPSIVAVSRSGAHGFSKVPCPRIELVAGLGVVGDAHAGANVQHRSRVARDPNQPNLRQVHVVGAELLAELGAAGFRVWPGSLGENLLTQGIELISLPRHTRLRLGSEAILEITGLRNPCRQLDDFAPGLMRAVLGRAPDGSLVRKAGVMGIVVSSGEVSPGDTIEIEMPAVPHAALDVV